MLEMALIDGVNDSDEAALELAKFAQVIIDSVPGIKLVCNLIPFNDIGHPYYRKPSMGQVERFQKILRDHSGRCYLHLFPRGKKRNCDPPPRMLGFPRFYFFPKTKTQL